MPRAHAEPGNLESASAVERKMLLDRLLVACGGRPITEPAPDDARRVLGMVLEQLIVNQWDDVPQTVREWMSLASAASTPRMARYHLAFGLTERPGLPPDGCHVDEDMRPHGEFRTWKDDDALRGYLGPPDPEKPPQLPAESAGSAIALLALIDLQASRNNETDRGSHCAYNIARVVSAESRWPPAVAEVLDASVRGLSHDSETVVQRSCALVGIQLPSSQAARSAVGMHSNSTRLMDEKGIKPIRLSAETTWAMISVRVVGERIEARLPDGRHEKITAERVNLVDGRKPSRPPRRAWMFLIACIELKRRPPLVKTDREFTRGTQAAERGKGTGAASKSASCARLALRALFPDIKGDPLPSKRGEGWVPAFSTEP